MKNKSNVINLGCRLNSYESEVILDILKKNKIVNTTVINTCAVTNQAVSKSKYEIRKAKKRHPKNKIIVTGCASHIDHKGFEKMEEIDQIIDNKSKTEKIFYKNSVHNLISETKKKVNSFPQELKKFSNKTRALIQIQQGCDHRCTFCIIPYGRGNSMSLPIGEIIKRTEKLIDFGYKEFILTGVDLTSYGNDLPGKPSLGETIRRLFKLQPKLRRLRLSSIDPAEIDENLLDLIMHEDRLLPHIHLSVQSGDNLILKRMKRRHERNDVINLCEKVRFQRPEVTFGADIIVGFPTEKEENFLNTLDCVKNCKFSNLHVFPFSPKKSTPAERMPQVRFDKIKERLKILERVGNEIKLDFMKEKLKKFDTILFEGYNLSYTRDYFKVKVINREKEQIIQKKGNLIKVRFLSISNGSFNAAIV